MVVPDPNNWSNVMFCPQDWLLQELGTQGAGITDPLDLPNSVLCSECMVNYWISKQTTSYLNYDDDDARDWTAIQKSKQYLTPHL